MRKYLKIVFGLLYLLKEYIINLGKLKIHGIKYCIGKNVKFWIYNGGYCEIGAKNWFSDFCCVEVNGGNVKIGYNNFFNSNCKIVSMKKIEIGDNNLFGPNVVIVDHKHKFGEKEELICNQGMETDDTILGSDIWICANVVICKGVIISDHIVVAANSVVCNDLLEPGLYAGSPAKKIK